MEAIFPLITLHNIIEVTVNYNNLIQIIIIMILTLPILYKYLVIIVILLIVQLYLLNGLHILILLHYY